MKVTIIPIAIGAFGRVIVTGGVGNKSAREDHQNYNIIENDQNTEKSPGDLRRLTVTPTPMKDHLLTLMWTTLKESTIIIIITRSFLENDSHKLLWSFNIQTDHLIPARRLDLIIIKKKKRKRICKIVDFAVAADHRINLKESEKKDKYLDLARELKKLWNMKVTIVPIVIGALGTVTKGLLKDLEDLEVGGWVETIQTTALLRTARILTRVLETWGDLLSLKLQWKTIS